VVLLRGEREQAPLAKQGAALLDYGFTLASAKTKPVGELVNKAPEAQPKQDGSAEKDDAASQPVNGKPTSDSARATAEADRSAFGNVGLPLVILAALAILLVAGLYLRRRKARLARANRTAT